MAKFCPVCNNSSDKVRFIGELCVNCTVAAYEKKMNIPDVVKVNICRSCGRIMKGQEYVKYSKTALAGAIEHEVGIPNCNVQLLTFEDNFATVRFTCDMEFEKASFDRRLAIKVGKQMCKTCSMRAGGYFESTVQLRGDLERAKMMSEKLTRFVERRGGFIAKLEEVTNGYDVYISSNQLVNAFMKVNELKPTRAYQLHGIRNGKKLYRNIYSLRFDHYGPLKSGKGYSRKG